MKHIAIKLVLSTIMISLCILLKAQSNIEKHALLYFPTDMLMERQLYEYWQNDTSFISLYTQAIGHSPNINELDSILNIQLYKIALNKNNRYSLVLQKLEEPILCHGYSKNVYRFTWFHNELKYDYTPYSIRIEENNIDNHIMYVSYCHWNKNTNCSINHDTITMNKKKWQDFIQIINEYDFGDAPSILDTLAIVYGGSVCILESYINGQYHAIFRNETLDPKMGIVKKHLWKLTGLKRNKSKVGF